MRLTLVWCCSVNFSLPQFRMSCHWLKAHWCNHNNCKYASVGPCTCTRRQEVTSWFKGIGCAAAACSIRGKPHVGLGHAPCMDPAPGSSRPRGGEEDRFEGSEERHDARR